MSPSIFLASGRSWRVPRFSDSEEIWRASHDVMDEERCARRAIIPPVPDRFLFLGRTGPPPRGPSSKTAETRREPCRPGEFWQGNGRERDPFLKKPPTGAAEKVRAEMAPARKKPSLPPFFVGAAKVSSGPVSGSSWHSVRIFSNVKKKGVRVGRRGRRGRFEFGPSPCLLPAGAGGRRPGEGLAFDQLPKKNRP
jgi:hypothetical protein